MFCEGDAKEGNFTLNVWNVVNADTGMFPNLAHLTVSVYKLFFVSPHS